MIQEKGDMKYEISGKIASGAFGIVWRVLIDGNEYAMKTVKQNDNYAQREEQLMQKLNHPNIVTYVNSWVSKSSLHLVMECVSSTVKEYIKTNTFSIESLRQAVHGIFSGLAYLDTLHICHRDIKPDNILYEPDTNDVKICDFGCAKELKDDELNTFYVCSRYYRAPELLLQARKYTTAVDMWSAACTICEMTTQKVLFHGTDSENHQFSEISKLLGAPTQFDYLRMNVPRHRFHGKKTYELKEVMYGHAQYELIDLLSQIFVYNPEKRLKAVDALNHIYFSSLSILDYCIHDVRECMQNGDSLGVEKCIKHMYSLMEEKHKDELDVQEKLLAIEYKAWINNPDGQSGRSKWPSPIAGVFSRIVQS